jgi:hypothetical protein
MTTHTETLTKLCFDFQKFQQYKPQLSAVLTDSQFANIGEPLQSSVIRIFEKKIEVILEDINSIQETDLDLVEQDIDTIIDRLSFAQKYFFENEFEKSIETYIDLYLMSDLDEEIFAYRRIQLIFDELLQAIHTYLQEIEYSKLISNLNTFL